MTFRLGIKPIKLTLISYKSTKYLYLESVKNSKIIYNARDSIRYEAKDNKLYLFGDAYVEYGEMNLKAEFIEIDNSKNLVVAYGTKDSTGKKIGTPVFKDNS